jgi:hypothetical protein
MPAVHPKAKFDAHLQNCRLLTGLIGNPPPIDDDSDEKDLVRTFKDFESSAAGMDCLHLFYTLFRRTIRGSYRERLDELLKSPDIADLYNVAHAQEQLFLADLKVTTSTGDAQEPPGDFSPFFALLKRGMLNKEATPWWTIHRDTFANDALTQETDEPVRDWYQRCFAPQLTAQNLCTEWPDAANAFGSSLQATLLVANCCPHLHSLLLGDSDHKLLVDPATMNAWDSSAIYHALHVLSFSPSYVATKADRTQLAAMVGALAAVADDFSKSTTKSKSTKQVGAANDYPNGVPQSKWDKSTQWADLSTTDQAMISAKYDDIRANSGPSIPGKDGKIEMKTRRNGSSPFLCFRWHDWNGCQRQGHRLQQCPLNGIPPVAEKSPHVPPAEAVALPAAAAAPLTQQTITDLFAALSMIAGTGSDVDDLAAKYAATPL